MQEYCIRFNHRRMIEIAWVLKDSYPPLESLLKVSRSHSMRIQKLPRIQKHIEKKERASTLKNPKEYIFWDSKLSSSSKGFTSRRLKCLGSINQSKESLLYQSSFFGDFFKREHLKSLLYFSLNFYIWAYIETSNHLGFFI